MAKRRLECPHCGKTVAVSEKAKKARCPGCKEVIDVEELLTASAREAPSEPEAAAKVEAEEAPAPEREEAPEEAEAPPEEPEEPEEPEQPEEPVEPVAPKEPEEVPEAKPPKERPSRRASRRATRRSGREKPARKAAPAAARGPVSWIPAAAGAVVVLIALWVFLIPWWAAIAVASGLWAFFDSTLQRITHMPGAEQGSTYAPLLWSVLCFIPFVGVAIYLPLRKRLTARSLEEHAPPGATPEDREESGQAIPPKLASPAVILPVAMAAVGIWFSLRPPSVELSIFERGRLSTKSSEWLDPGELTVRLEARKELDMASISYEVVKFEKGEEKPAASGSVPVSKRTVSWDVIIEEGGKYEVRVSDPDGGGIASRRFNVRMKK